MSLHPTALIHPSAQVDPTAEIGPFAVIGEDAVIGAGTAVGAHAVVEFATLGKNNRLSPGCFVGTPPQDLKYKGERTRLLMGDDNVVREGVTLNRGTAATGETRIGSRCIFMANSHVAHDCRLGSNVILVNSVGVAGHIEIGDFAVLGGISGYHQFIRIGRFCMIGGGSMVGKDIPPFCTCQGDRATLRGLNLLGLRRAGFGHDAVAAVKAAYKTLFLSG
ncbi:MAG TPA: acyl-[acyl-carrier-protein]--UDP-N-acetylglucosamine O-acyltransferase, partial [Elusimicrobia bacterium]|nr:acyl-[acyl-carrier-protein]--UDP-N-acetylglucosamine O-acyltransferase [Elusimicrobiota bacterium]